MRKNSDDNKWDYYILNKKIPFYDFDSKLKIRLWTLKICRTQNIVQGESSAKKHCFCDSLIMNIIYYDIDGASVGRCVIKKLAVMDS